VEISKRWGVVAIVGMVGLGLVGYGVWEAVKPEEAVVEIVSVEDREVVNREMGIVYVDVGGAVEKPGVYELASGSRIGEALGVAGGLAARADRVWVSRYLNLAEEVKDGGKIYIPSEGEEEGEKEEKREVTGEVRGKININTASTRELDSLWGIGEARAQAIIDNRPYASIEELSSKAGISSNVYEEIKDEISVY